MTSGCSRLRAHVQMCPPIVPGVPCLLLSQRTLAHIAHSGTATKATCAHSLWHSIRAVADKSARESHLKCGPHLVLIDVFAAFSSLMGTNTRPPDLPDLIFQLCVGPRQLDRIPCSYKLNCAQKWGPIALTNSINYTAAGSHFEGRHQLSEHTRVLQ